MPGASGAGLSVVLYQRAKRSFLFPAKNESDGCLKRAPGLRCNARRCAAIVAVVCACV